MSSYSPEETIFDVIMKNEKIKTNMIVLLKSLINFCWEIDCQITGESRNLVAFMKKFEPPSYRYSGAISAEALHSELSNVGANLNMREIMVAIMQYSFNVSPYLWILIMNSHANVIPEAFLKNFNIKSDVLRKRINSIEERFGIDHKTMYELTNSKNTKYVHKSQPVPTWQHAVSESLKHQENLTFKLKQMFPRVPANDFIYGQILEGYEPRVKADFLPHQMLSKHEIAFINRKTKTDFFGLFVDTENNPTTVLPWQCGFLSARADPDNYYISIAKHYKRYSFIGPSGTTEIMMNIAEIFGVDLNIMALACIGWMYSVLDHTLFELMIIINMFLDESYKFKFEPGLTYDANLTIDRTQVIYFYNTVCWQQQWIENEDAAVNLTKYSNTELWHEKRLFPNNRSILDIINIPHLKISDTNQQGGRVNKSCYHEAIDIIKKLKSQCSEKTSCDVSTILDSFGTLGCMETQRQEEPRLEHVENFGTFPQTQQPQAQAPNPFIISNMTDEYYNNLPNVDLSQFEDDVPIQFIEKDKKDENIVLTNITIQFSKKIDLPFKY